MNFMRIGNTNIDCSIVGLGTGRLASVSGGVSRTVACQLLDAAQECGINLIDTADSYAQGECEKIIGQYLKKKRSKFVVTTKAGYCFSSLSGGLRLVKPLAKRVLKYFKGGRNLASSVRTTISRQDFRPGIIRKSIESSLQRLQTDYLDIFLLHTPPLPIMAEEQVLALLRQLKQEGKIRCFGVSSHDPNVLAAALQDSSLSVVQTPVNPFRTGHREILRKLQGGNMGVVANQIFLSGKLVEPQPGYGGEEKELSLLKSRLNLLAVQKGISLNRLLIKYALNQPGVVSILTGTTNPEHLKQNVADALSSDALSAEDFALIAGREGVTP